MGALIVSDNEKARVQEILEYAKGHPYTLEDIKNVIAGQKRPAGKNDHYCMMFPVNIGVVFSYETHRNNKELRHISISQKNGKLPNLFIVQEIMELFGFRYAITALLSGEKKPPDVHMYEEATRNGKAINILEELEKPLP